MIDPIFGPEETIKYDKELKELEAADAINKPDREGAYMDETALALQQAQAP